MWNSLHIRCVGAANARKCRSSFENQLHERRKSAFVQHIRCTAVANAQKCRSSSLRSRLGARNTWLCLCPAKICSPPHSASLCLFASVPTGRDSTRAQLPSQDNKDYVMVVGRVDLVRPRIREITLCFVLCHFVRVPYLYLQGCSPTQT